MRNIDIDFTGADAPVDFFAGYAGEVDNTQLTIRLPENLCSEDIDYYRIHFKTANHETTRSGKLYAQEDLLTLTLWYELVRIPGTLLMQISAYDFEDSELIHLGKTPVATLRVRPSLSADMEANPALHGLEAELEELINGADSGSFSVMVNTFTDLPSDVRAGTLAVVNHPPPRYLRRSVQPIVGIAHYPRLYLNPYPPRPEHVYTGDDPFAEMVFKDGKGNYYESSPTFFFLIFDGTSLGFPVMLQIMPDLSIEGLIYIYVWDEFDMDETQHILPGWYRTNIDPETGQLLSLDVLSIDELPVLEYAGISEYSSVYLGYYLSPEPYFKTALNALYVFDGTQWQPLYEEDTSIQPLGTISVRGIDFNEYTMDCTLGVPQYIERATVYPFFATNKNIEYVIGNESILSLAWQEDEEGIQTLYVTGLMAGTTTVTATTQDGNFSGTRTINVLEVQT